MLDDETFDPMAIDPPMGSSLIEAAPQAYSSVYTTQTIGTTRRMTPDGYLLCVDVPIARCGTLLYAAHELVGLSDKNGVIFVERLEEDVFAQNAIDSFAGKPVVITHGPGFVTPDNWKDLTVGVVLNPRRGTGQQEGLLLADLLITDSDAIAQIMSKGPTDSPQEVSAGYSAEYEQLAPGRARQYDIIGNHVALVDAGRCGARCSIGDHAMATKPRTKVRVQRQRTAPPDPLANLRRAFQTRDARAFEDALNEMDIPDVDGGHLEDGQGAGDYPVETSGGGGGTSITVNISGAAPDGGPATDPTAPVNNNVDTMPGGVNNDGDDGNPAGGAGGGDVLQMVTALSARMDAMEAAFAQLSGGTGDSLPDGGPPDVEEGEGEEGDDKKKPPTNDHAALLVMHRDVTAKAAILVPGMRPRTFDAKVTTLDHLCGFRRDALVKAAADPRTAEMLKPLIGERVIGKMTCDAATLLFDAAAAIVGGANNARIAAQISPRRLLETAVEGKGPMSPAEINAANRKAHARQN